VGNHFARITTASRPSRQNYDPDNFFSVNQNIKPRSSGGTPIPPDPANAWVAAYATDPVKLPISRPMDRLDSGTSTRVFQRGEPVGMYDE
jgi:hypothetical protein